MELKYAGVDQGLARESSASFEINKGSEFALPQFFHLSGSSILRCTWLFFLDYQGYLIVLANIQARH